MAKEKAKQKTQAEKEAAFRTMAAKHTNTAINALAKLGKCGNPRKYASNPKQIETIRNAIQSAAENALRGLTSGGSAAGGVSL